VSECEGSQREREAKTGRPVAPGDGVDSATPPAGPAEKGTQIVLDCRGRRCPLPVIELARRIAGVRVGEQIAVAADDPAARLDVPAWCRMRGHDFLGESPAEDGVPTYTVRRRR
jgi:tRNA 2-thiouridine synthesizing protein A